MVPSEPARVKYLNKYFKQILNKNLIIGFLLCMVFGNWVFKLIDFYPYIIE